MDKSKYIKIFMWKNDLINKLINWYENRNRMFIKRWINESIDKWINDEINKWKKVNK